VLGLDNFWLSIGGVFVGSMALGFLAVKLKRRSHPPIPKLNAVIRLTSAGRVYRSHFIGVRSSGWAITPPIQRDDYIAIRPGEPVIIEAVMEKGIAVFRTTLKEISKFPPMLVVDKPAFWHVDDRRDSIRIEDIGHMQAKLDGNKVALVDMSACGARVRSQAGVKSGERVKLEVAGLNDAVYGWVLDSDRRGDRYILRLRFEEETDMSIFVGA
jgi:hypothetical protein